MRPFLSSALLAFFFLFFTILPSSCSSLFSDLLRPLFFFFLFFSFFFFAFLLGLELSSPLDEEAPFSDPSSLLLVFSSDEPQSAPISLTSRSLSPPLSKGVTPFFLAFLSLGSEPAAVLFFLGWSFWASSSSRRLFLRILSSFSRAVTLATLAALSPWSFSLGDFSLFSSSPRFFSLSFLIFNSPGEVQGSRPPSPLDLSRPSLLKYWPNIAFASLPYPPGTSPPKRSSSFHVLHFPRCTVTSCCPAAGHSSVGPLQRW